MAVGAARLRRSGLTAPHQVFDALPALGEVLKGEAEFGNGASKVRVHDSEGKAMKHPMRTETAEAKGSAKYQTFKAAWGASLASSRYPLKWLAAEAGMSYSALAHTADEGTLDHISMRRFIALLPFVGTEALDWLEARVGRVAFRVPEADADSTRIVSEAMKSFAALLDAKARALDDGRVTADEVTEIEQAAHEVMRRAAALAARAKQLQVGSVAA